MVKSKEREEILLSALKMCVEELQNSDFAYREPKDNRKLSASKTMAVFIAMGINDCGLDYDDDLIPSKYTNNWKEFVNSIKT